MYLQKQQEGDLMAIKTKNSILDVDELEIPNELKQLNQWVLWRAEWNNSRQHYTKVPYRVNGVRASSTNQDTWSNFHDVYSLYENSDDYEGIGFILSEESKYICLDIDNAVDAETHKLQTELGIEMTELTYCELSPSGTGLHCFFKGTLPENRKSKRTDLDIELYHTSRFMTFTGYTIGGSEISDDQGVIDNLVERFFKAEPKKQNIRIAKTGSSIFTDDEIFRMITKKVNIKNYLQVITKIFLIVLAKQSKAY